ncbi:MAG: hypothetical protein K8Q97_02390 [Candidatus Andersenbacteria bacterium]|nr:hypothetical protein [Candidatus Andersenbacteria bacterium]
MARPVTIIDELMWMLPDMGIKEVYLPFERLLITGGLSACAALLSAVLLVYGSYMYLRGPDKESRKRFLPVVLMALACMLLAGVSAGAIFYSGTRITPPSMCV